MNAKGYQQTAGLALIGRWFWFHTAWVYLIATMQTIHRTIQLHEKILDDGGGLDPHVDLDNSPYVTSIEILKLSKNLKNLLKIYMMKGSIHSKINMIAYGDAKRNRVQNVYNIL